MHAGLLVAGALAVLATAALSIEGKAAFPESAGNGSGHGSKQVADMIKHAGIGGRIAAGSAADG